MKTVYFDLLNSQPARGAKYHGGGEYIKAVFKELCLNFLDNIKLRVMYNPKLFIDDWVLELIKKNKLHEYYVESPNQIVSIINDRDNLQNSVFYTGMIYPYSGLALNKEILKIGVCHGLRALECPCDYKEWMYIDSIRKLLSFTKRFLLRTIEKKRIKEFYFNSIDGFDIIITDSKHSEYSIRMTFPELLQKKKLFTFYAPPKVLDVNFFEQSFQTNCKEEYILIISADRWEKNASRAIKALDALYSKKIIKIKTYIVGNLTKTILSSITNKSNFLFFDYVTTQKLDSLYKNCSILLYPTLNEGFGYPPLEAMRYSKTCVISAVSCLTEIYGESVYYINPYDINEISNHVLYSLENRISSKIIKEKYDSISYRQKRDLTNQCKLICGEC